jgi:hypothetical protein
MFKNILVPLDGSVLAARALPFAKRLARVGGARLIVVRAYLPADDALLLRVEYPEFSAAERADVDRETATEEFQSAIDELRVDGLDVDAHFVEGAAAEVIFNSAKAAQAGRSSWTEMDPLAARHVMVNGRDAPYLEHGLDTPLLADDTLDVFAPVGGD